MNSGLYALAGASATATAAACANRLDEPMTNVSNRYFGLSRAGSTTIFLRLLGALPEVGGLQRLLAAGVEGVLVVGAHRLAAARRRLGTRTTGSTLAGLQVGVDRDREPGLAAERVAERGVDLAAHPRLEVVLGEVVADGEQHGAVEQAERLGELDERRAARGDVRAVLDLRERAVPDMGDALVLSCHGHPRCRSSLIRPEVSHALR